MVLMILTSVVMALAAKSVTDDIGTILSHFATGFCGYLSNLKSSVSHNMDLRDASASKNHPVGQREQ